ncbi:unnamed protein product [Cylicostephanus goldi]|uniref:Pre-mRNA-splicing factor SLU7 n=1 Tax=Cylicostephanus goldi TaxID=71465 RepID=A0A3P6RN93_CYLGO|nr:unnamed protein product [Cylicostephanus goldi]
MNHTSVFGSYWKNGQWGYKCCHSFIKNSFCLQEEGLKAEKESAATVERMGTLHLGKRRILLNVVIPEPAAPTVEAPTTKTTKKEEPDMSDQASPKSEPEEASSSSSSSESEEEDSEKEREMERERERSKYS